MTNYAYAVAGSPWVLTLADGVAIGAAILGVWALAWSIRAIAQALQVDEAAG